MASYRLTTRADQELAQILIYTIETWGAEQFSAYRDLLKTAFERIAEFPNIGRYKAPTPTGTLTYHVGRHYIVYRLQSDIVEILTILDDRQDFESRVNL